MNYDFWVLDELKEAKVVSVHILNLLTTTTYYK